MIVCAPTISPPPPSPCTARKAMSSVMVWLKPRQRRPDHEDDDGGLEEGLAPVLVAQLPPQWRRDGRRQQVGRDHPGQVRPPVQVAHDGGQRRRDDGLVQGRQQHAQQQRAEDEPQPTLGDRLGHGRCCDGAHPHLPDVCHDRLRVGTSCSKCNQGQPTARCRRTAPGGRRRPRYGPAADAGRTPCRINMKEGQGTCELASRSCSASSTPSCWPEWGVSRTPNWRPPSRRPAASAASVPAP